MTLYPMESPRSRIPSITPASLAVYASSTKGRSIPSGISIAASSIASAVRGSGIASLLRSKQLADELLTQCVLIRHFVKHRVEERRRIHCMRPIDESSILPDLPVPFQPTEEDRPRVIPP